MGKEKSWEEIRSERAAEFAIMREFIEPYQELANGIKEGLKKEGASYSIILGIFIGFVHNLMVEQALVARMENLPFDRKRSFELGDAITKEAILGEENIVLMGEIHSLAQDGVSEAYIQRFSSMSPPERASIFTSLGQLFMHYNCVDKEFNRATCGTFKFMRTAVAKRQQQRRSAANGS